MDIDCKSIGARIRYERQRKSLSQGELAELADVSPIYVSNIERGEKSPSLKTIISFANALDVSTDTFLVDNLTSFSKHNDDQVFKILADCYRDEQEIIVRNIRSLKKILRDYKITK